MTVVARSGACSSGNYSDQILNVSMSTWQLKSVKAGLVFESLVQSKILLSNSKCHSPSWLVPAELDAERQVYVNRLIREAVYQISPISTS